MKEELSVIGYPRSGNVWLARLLGHILDSEIASAPGTKSIADEGSERSGKYVIRQRHSEKRVNGKVVFMYRDPRDVAVSAMEYWQYKSLMDMFTSNRKGIRVIEDDMVGGWHLFMNLWLNEFGVDATVSYEGLHLYPQIELADVLENLGEIVDRQKIHEAIEVERFDVRKNLISCSPDDTYPYGKGIQLQHMRKGVIGDWKNHFTQETAKLVHEQWWEWLDKLGYETDEDWWKELEE